MVAVVALYVLGLVTLIGSVTVTIVDGTANRLGDWVDVIGVIAVVLVALAGFLVAGTLVALLGWRGLPRRTLRLAARPSSCCESQPIALVTRRTRTH
jgi:hypothetical protein